jgi:hypothetical protein
MQQPEHPARQKVKAARKTGEHAHVQHQLTLNNHLR